jgi:hypothetical protein
MLGVAAGRRTKQAVGYDFIHVAVDDCWRVADWRPILTSVG